MTAVRAVQPNITVAAMADWRRMTASERLLGFLLRRFPVTAWYRFMPPRARAKSPATLIATISRLSTHGSLWLERCQGFLGVPGASGRHLAGSVSG